MNMMILKPEKILLALFAIGIMTACSSPEPEVEEEETEVVVEEVVVEEVEWIILEDGFGTDGTEKVSLTAPKEEQPEEAAEPEMEPITHDEFAARIQPLEYMEPSMIEIEVTEAIIPINETETLTAYNSKGKEKGSIQVIHDSQTGELVSVMYSHFLYSDVSNIMYVLDVKDNMGDEYTEVELDQFEVDAIVWKDKKHHKDLEEITF